MREGWAGWRLENGTLWRAGRETQTTGRQPVVVIFTSSRLITRLASRVKMSLWEVMFVVHHKLLGASVKTSCNLRPELGLNINHINVTRPQHNHIFCLRAKHKTLSRYWIRRNLTLLAAHYLCCLGYANFPLVIFIRVEKRRGQGKNSNEKIAWQRGVLRSRAQFDQADTRMNTIVVTRAQMSQGSDCY